MQKLTGTALITGASEGIGRALAHTFAAHGHDLVLTARNRERLDSLKTELEAAYGVTVTVIPGDLADPATPARLHREIAGLGIIIEILVNNAGFGLYGPYLERERDAGLELLQVNISALSALTHIYAREMVARGRGHIMNVASTIAFAPGAQMAVYAASKAYVLSFSEALREELRDGGVGVTCLCPGLTESEFHVRSGFDRSGLMKMGMTSAEAVAEIGYRGLRRGKAIVVVGLRGRAAPFGVRFLPRALVRRLTAKALSR